MGHHKKLGHIPLDPILETWATFDFHKPKVSNPLVLEIHANDAANREINSITIAHNIKGVEIQQETIQDNTSMETRVLAKEETTQVPLIKQANSITPI